MDQKKSSQSERQTILNNTLGTNFTVRNPSAATGRAHLVEVVCDLCHQTTDVDTTKVTHVMQAVEAVAADHVCKKTDRAKARAEEARGKEMLPTAETVKQAGVESREERLRR